MDAIDGSGPRHLAVHPTKRVLYVLHEMANQLSAHAISPSLTRGADIRAPSAQALESSSLPRSAGQVDLAP